jgi:hypothetical protein
MFRGSTKLFLESRDLEMIVHIVGQRHSFISSTRIRDFHFEMFHGRATRDGVASPHHVFLSLDNRPQSPLHLIRNAFATPDIFEPAENLIVSQAVRDKLERLPNIEFDPIVFEKLYWLEYQPGDFSFYAAKEDRPAQYRGLPRLMNDLCAKLPDKAEAHSSIGVYYEVVVASTRELRTRFDYTEIDVVLADGRDAEKRTVDVLANFMSEYPLYNSRGLWVIEESLFEKLRSHFDWDYFVTTSISLKV